MIAVPMSDAPEVFGRPGGVRTAEPFGRRPDQYAESGSGEVVDLAGDSEEHRPRYQRLQDCHQVGVERRMRRRLAPACRPRVPPARYPHGVYSMALAGGRAATVLVVAFAATRRPAGKEMSCGCWMRWAMRWPSAGR